VLNGAAETVVVTRPRPAAAMVPRIRDRIYVSFWFFLRRMCFNAKCTFKFLMVNAYFSGVPITAKQHACVRLGPLCYSTRKLTSKAVEFNEAPDGSRWSIRSPFARSYVHSERLVVRPSYPPKRPSEYRVRAYRSRISFLFYLQHARAAGRSTSTI
jgi:hypothetical protein